MKKLSAILLIILFLFNLFGYRVLFYYAQQQSDITLEHNLDQNNYNENELIALTIPLSMPYQHNSDGFERFDGEITLNGKIYKYVKRKYCDGKITFLCLPDYNKMHLEAAKNNYGTNINGIQNNGTNNHDNSKSAIGKNLSTDYEQNVSDYAIVHYKSINKYSLLDKAFPLTTAIVNSPEQPPELT
ncbi:hypothetical protein FW778_18185 [Ginsengibacter hankyongi]|uniref:Uncharacterized protein n=1 Tax=Ginsengibacter hankyongi TaxID=2607284 RepID=A0A5J5ICL6_9BACT|nr:hypothetical protein [Ginsengibacter hankyongi]KAA9036548.1 hypothetical protein FW778_18185 [Ginsengibacter hankyongi]